MELFITSLSMIFVSNIVLSKLFGLNVLYEFEDYRENEIKVYLSMFVSALASVNVVKIISLINILPNEALYLLGVLVAVCVAKIIFLKCKVDNKYLIYIVNNILLYGIINNFKTDILKMNIMVLFTTLGFVMFSYAFNAIKYRLDVSDIPKPFKGIALYMVVIALMILSLSGLNGLF